MTFTKDYTSLIAEAKANGDSSLAAELNRQMNNESYLQDENAQREAARKVALKHNANLQGTSGKKI